MSIFELGPFRLDADHRTVSLDGVPLALTPKAVETLVALVERAGSVVSKGELLDRIWPDGDVEEANLAQNVYLLRKALRANADGEWIATVPRRGYRFTGPVRTPRPVEAHSSHRPKRAVPAPWLAAAFAALIVLVLVPTVRARVHGAGSALSPAGTQAFALGRYYWNQRTRDGLEKSVHYFAQVVRSDARSPLGYAGMAEAYGLMPQYDVRSVPKNVALKRAWKYARRALALDPASAEAHAIVGELQSESSKAGGAGRAELERAVALDPQNAAAHLWLGVSFFEGGDTQTARSEFEASERLDPAAPATESWLADVLFLSREYDAAAEHLHRALDVDPNRADALATLGTVEVQRGAYGQALAAYARFARACDCGRYPAVLRAYAYARMRHAAQAHAALAEAQRSMPGGKNLSIDVAFVYVALGERRAALESLERAHSTEPAKTSLIAADPRLDPVRSDRRFRKWTEGRDS
jgi:DNA-binding winged helix-turn-helix (wHTH) protein/Flp pilus assembly protein TadD